MITRKQDFKNFIRNVEKRTKSKLTEKDIQHLRRDKKIIILGDIIREFRARNERLRKMWT